MLIVKNILILLVLLVSTLWSEKVNATMDKVYIPCLQCGLTQAESAAKSEGDRLGGLHVFKEMVVFDPVSETVRTFYYQRSFEPEWGETIVEVDRISDDQGDVLAISAYKNLLDLAYTEFAGEPPTSAKNIEVFGEQLTSVSRHHWIYSILSGNTVVPVEQPSYSGMLANSTGAIEISNQLRLVFQLESLSGSLSLATKNALLEYLTELPMQITVVFLNGDSVTFFLDCITCSVSFLPLHETAVDKNGVKLTNASSTGSAGSGHSAGYGLFYDNVNDSSLEPTRICINVKTGVNGGGYVSQKVCYVIYL